MENFLGNSETKGSREKPKNDEKIKTYEATIRQRVEFEERAFHIVNKLIYGCVEPHYLLECAKFINIEHYNDIIEERAISRLCGYPLCDNELKNIPKQKYFISTKTNKVYDISERKSFCSNQCLKASKAFHSQISESPVWAREHEPPPEFTLLPHKAVRGIIGTEVIGEAPWKSMESELESLHHLDTKDSSTYNKKKEYSEIKDERDEISKIKSSSKKAPAPGSNAKADEAKLADDLGKLSIKETHTDKKLSPCDQELNSNVKNMACDQKEEKILEKSNDHKGSGQSHERKKVKADTHRTMSALDQLNMLLSKRKNVLSGMVDFQEFIPSTKGAVNVPNSKNIKPDATSKETNKIDEAKILEGMDNSDTPDKTPFSISNVDIESSEVLQTKNTHERKSHISANASLSPLQQICKIIQPWITDNTKQYLRASLEEDSKTHGFSDPKIQSGYVDLCKRLDYRDHLSKDALDDMTQHTKSDSASSKRQFVPNYEHLKKESEQFQLQVTEFITGKKVKVKDVQPFKEEEKEDGDQVLLPSVDLYDQMMIRAKIVLDRLDKTVPDLLVPMGLTVQDVYTYLRELVYSFRLERDNIMFRPPEWTLVALVVLKMLALKVSCIDSAFKKDTTILYLNTLLKGIGQTNQDLCMVVESILQ